MIFGVECGEEGCLHWQHFKLSFAEAGGIILAAQIVLVIVDSLDTFYAVVWGSRGMCYF